MRVIAKINTAFGTHLSVRVLFDAPSISNLSQQLGRHASMDSFASVHGRDTTKVHAGDLTLDKFLDAATLTSLLANLPAGTWELVTHPGYNDMDLAQAHTRLRASREIEMRALLATEQLPDLDLISFADL